jgi:hypothetical protein
MGYWWPPSLYAYDPVVRPLLWTKMPAKDAAPILGFPVNFFPNPDMLIVVPDEYDRELLSFLAQTPLGKSIGGLGVYYSMLEQRAPEDPPGGGLCADSIDESGAAIVNYYDFADSKRVYRKRVKYVQGKSGGQEIANRNDQEGGVPQMLVNGTWQKEGADAEREFGKAGLQIVNAIGSIAAAVLAMIPGAQIPATAFGAMWAFTMKELQNGGKPPDVGDVLSMAQAFGKAVGPGLWSVVSNVPSIEKVFSQGAIAEMARVPGQWTDKIGGLVNNIGGTLPFVDLKKLWQNFNPTDWANGQLKKLPTPTNVTQGLFGMPGHEVDLASRQGPSAIAFKYAARGFAEQDPKQRAAIRRNFLWTDVWNSSAVSMGNPQGVGAHNEVEQDDGLLSAASYFDQYLASLLQSGINAAIYAQQGVGGPVVDLKNQRLNDPEAQNALRAYVAVLMDRYHMV